MEKTIYYNGSPGSVIRHGDLEIEPRVPTKVPAELAEELATHPYMHVRILEDDVSTEDDGRELREPDAGTQTGTTLTGMGEARQATLTEPSTRGTRTTIDNKEN